MKREIYFWVLLIVVIAAAALYFRYFYQQQISMGLVMNGSSAGSFLYPYQNARLPISVYNYGSSPIMNMSIGLFVNGNLLTLYRVTLPAGKQTVIPFNYTPTVPGTVNITAEADPSRLYYLSSRKNTTSGILLTVLRPANATPYALLPSNGMILRHDLNLSRSGYAVDAYLYGAYNESEFAIVDNALIRNFLGPVLNLTASYISSIQVSDAKYGNGDKAYSIWINGYLSPSIFGTAANGMGVNANTVHSGVGNVTFVKISNGTTFCSWYSGGWNKILAYSGSMACYQALGVGAGMTQNSAIANPVRGKLTLTGASVIANYTGVSGAANYAATLSLLGNSSFVYAKIANHTAVNNVCYGLTANVNGMSFCSTYQIPVSGKIGGASSLMKTTAYAGTQNLTVMSLLNASLLSQQVQMNIGIIRSFNISGTPITFQSGLVNGCSFNASFPCTNVSFSNGTVRFALKNGIGNGIKLNSLSCYATAVLNPTSTPVNQVVAAGATYNAMVPCYNYLGKISGIAYNLNLGLGLNYSVANVTHALSGNAYILLGSA
jgi:CARDB